MIRVFVADAAGKEFELADGGLTSWTQKLLSNHKEQFLIGGIGTERACGLFGDIPTTRASEP